MLVFWMSSFDTQKGDGWFLSHDEEVRRPEPAEPLDRPVVVGDVRSGARADRLGDRIAAAERDRDDAPREVPDRLEVAVTLDLDALRHRNHLEVHEPHSLTHGARRNVGALASEAKRTQGGWRETAG